VLLADLTAKEAPGEPSRYTDASRGLCAMRIAGCSPPELLAHRDDEREREHEEAARILYVAATRARDLLVVPVVGDERRDGWLGALHPVVHPAEARRRQPESATSPGCPRFGLDSVATRPERAPGRERSVAPGLHAPEVGEHRVVWWDPAVLTLAVEETVGLRQQKLLEADESGATSERGVRAHAAWRETRVRVRAVASQPTAVVETASAWATSCLERPPTTDVAARAADVVVVSARDGAVGARPSGARFGVLVHAVLAVIDLDADDDALAATAALQARIVGAPEEETAAAAATVRDALAHALVRRAAAATRVGQCRREVALALTLDDGMLIEGVADLVFRDDHHDDAAATWTVVDFKTDRELAGRLPEYRWQLAVYAAAVARATGEPTRAVVLGV
jgi:ATP-dependent exoDNAse (exonuclease V) beta subunit